MSEPTLADDLVAFLWVRLDEDEQAARAAIKPEAMYPWGDTSLPQMPVESWPDAVRGYLGGTWGEHCARHDPVRVLREVDAKRRIIDLHEPVPHALTVEEGGGSYLACAVCPHPRIDIPHVLPCDTLRLLALPYVDHPDYREGWKP